MRLLKVGIAGGSLGGLFAAVLLQEAGHRKFVVSTGTTPAEAVERIRSEIARSLLQTTDLKVAQIAGQTGFGSESALRRALQRQFGVSARDLRERF